VTTYREALELLEWFGVPRQRAEEIAFRSARIDRDLRELLSPEMREWVEREDEREAERFVLGTYRPVEDNGPDTAA
jgi:hypothetical protein